MFLLDYELRLLSCYFLSGIHYACGQLDISCGVLKFWQMTIGVQSAFVDACLRLFWIVT